MAKSLSRNKQTATTETLTLDFSALWNLFRPTWHPSRALLWPQSLPMSLSLCPAVNPWPRRSPPTYLSHGSPPQCALSLPSPASLQQFLSLQYRIDDPTLTYYGLDSLPLPKGGSCGSIGSLHLGRPAQDLYKVGGQWVWSYSLKILVKFPTVLSNIKHVPLKLRGYLKR